MIHYKVITASPHRHFISFEAKFPTAGATSMRLQLPAWRPGRYELGNFSKNIRAWQSFGAGDEILPFIKINKDLWEVNCAGHAEVVIRYQYYAAELNAGSSYLDDEQLYINPVNCFFYNTDNMDSPYEISFDLPASYQVACGLQKVTGGTLHAKNFDELADCPLIASPSLRHLQYVCSGINYHIWIQGEVRLDEARLLREFELFTASQVKIFGDIPCDEYHFLFQFTQVFQRHGVEHGNSTVIAMGPAADFQNDALFKDLLGISCHELFHTWNVKSIRPVEMMPYDFTKENYSRLGYVAEGVTTYYGDLLLWRSGAISDIEWYNVIDERLQNHFENSGRFNLSVADSSFETWLDGYSAGIPGRKVSIYNEGFLIALICDVEIMRNSSYTRSMDDVMKKMYADFGKKGIGYSEAQYRNAVEDIHGQSLDSIFSSIVYGTRDYSIFLENAFDQLGLQLMAAPGAKWTEPNLGLMVDEINQKVIVQSVITGSPADSAGLWNGDEILLVNDIAPYKNFHTLMKMYDGNAELTVQSKNRMKKIRIIADGGIHAKRYHVLPLMGQSEEQLKMFRFWKFREKQA